MKSVPKSLYPLLGGTVLYIVAFLIYSIMVGNIEFVYYSAVVIFFFWLLLAYHEQLGLSKNILWALSLWGLLHMAGGNIPINGAVLYNLELVPILLKYDQLVHAFGFGTTTIVAWQLLQPQLKDSYSKRTVGTLLVMIGMGAGALNEVVEFVAVLIIPDTNVGGYYNTGFDMVFNLIGACIALCIIRVGWRKKQSA